MDGAADPVDGLIERHLPLVRSIARRYAGSGEPFDELVQVGSVGLVAAARRYDPNRGVPFAAYAAPTVDGELRRHLRDRTSTIRVPRREQALAGELRRAAVATAQQLGHEASLTEIAAAAGLSRHEAERVLGGTAAATPLTLLDGEASVAASAEMEACERRVLLHAALAALEPGERRALALRFGAELSLREVGRRLGISEGRATRVVRRALEKVRTGIDA